MTQIKVSRMMACLSHSAASCADGLVSDDRVVLETAGVSLWCVCALFV